MVYYPQFMVTIIGKIWKIWKIWEIWENKDKPKKFRDTPIYVQTKPDIRNLWLWQEMTGDVVDTLLCEWWVMVWILCDEALKCIHNNHTVYSKSDKNLWFEKRHVYKFEMVDLRVPCWFTAWYMYRYIYIYVYIYICAHNMMYITMYMKVSRVCKDAERPLHD